MGIDLIQQPESPNQKIYISAFLVGSLNFLIVIGHSTAKAEAKKVMTMENGEIPENANERKIFFSLFFFHLLKPSKKKKKITGLCQLGNL